MYRRGHRIPRLARQIYCCWDRRHRHLARLCGERRQVQAQDYLQIHLAADPERSAIEAMGCGRKDMYGRKYFGVERPPSSSTARAGSRRSGARSRCRGTRRRSWPPLRRCSAVASGRRRGRDTGAGRSFRRKPNEAFQGLDGPGYCAARPGPHAAGRRDPRHHRAEAVEARRAGQDHRPAVKIAFASACPSADECVSRCSARPRPRPASLTRPALARRLPPRARGAPTAIAANLVLRLREQGRARARKGQRQRRRGQASESRDIERRQIGREFRARAPAPKAAVAAPS